MNSIYYTTMWNFGIRKSDAPFFSSSIFLHRAPKLPAAAQYVDNPKKVPWYSWKVDAKRSILIFSNYIHLIQRIAFPFLDITVSTNNICCGTSTCSLLEVLREGILVDKALPLNYVYFLDFFLFEMILVAFQSGQKKTHSNVAAVRLSMQNTII